MTFKLVEKLTQKPNNSHSNKLMLERTSSLGYCNCSILLSLPETRSNNNTTQISPLFRSRSSLSFRPVQSEDLLYSHTRLDKNTQTGSEFPNRHYTGTILFCH